MCELALANRPATAHAHGKLAAASLPAAQLTCAQAAGKHSLASHSGGGGGGQCVLCRQTAGAPLERPAPVLRAANCWLAAGGGGSGWARGAPNLANETDLDSLKKGLSAYSRALASVTHTH